MRVLVTGSSGYIGCVLTPLLREEGHDVTGLDTDLFAACSYGGDPPPITTICKDVRDVDPADLAGFDAVVHLAGLSNDPLGYYRPSLTHEINVDGTLRVAHAARRAGVRRFVYASSCSVYGAAGTSFLTEKTPFNPVTPYGESKAEAERRLRELADGRFTVTFLRASTAYGMSPRLRFDLVANNLTAWAFTTGAVYLKSDGSPWRPIIHVEDIARAYAAVLRAPPQAVQDQAFNVGTTSENYQIRDIAALVESIVPGSIVKFSPDASPDTRCYRVDCNKIARCLHEYKPQWTARRGIEQLHAEFSRCGLRQDEFEGPRFKRIDHVKQLIDQGIIDRDLRRIAPHQPELKT